MRSQTVVRMVDAWDVGWDSDEEMEEDESMDEPVVLRGLLQCIGIGGVCTTRYLLDVLFTPRVVQTISRQLMSVMKRISGVALYAPVASLVLLHMVSSFEFGSILRVLLRFCILRGVLGAVLDDTVVVGGLRKRHIWVPLAWWVTFTRVSSGRSAPTQSWQSGHRHLLCCGLPWAIRLGAISVCWPTLYSVPSTRDSWFGGHRLAFEQDRHYEQRPPHKPEEPEEPCTSFTGFPVPCDELQRIRAFNRDVMPSMHAVGHRGVRKAMNDRDYHGHVWHVGHACPDPSKRSMNNEEDFGWNLFAQHAVDNLHLGHCLVSCAETKHYHAHHVPCTDANRCVQVCAAK